MIHSILFLSLLLLQQPQFRLKSAEEVIHTQMDNGFYEMACKHEDVNNLSGKNEIRKDRKMYTFLTQIGDLRYLREGKGQMSKQAYINAKQGAIALENETEERLGLVDTDKNQIITYREIKEYRSSLKKSK